MITKKKTSLLFCIIVLVILGAMLGLVGVVKNTISAERMAAAETVEIGFSKGIAETFGNINYAAKLSYSIDLDDINNLDLFKKNTQKLIQENEHVIYAAYFNEDTLNYIYPSDEFDSLIGKNMADFSYCFTLAKVVMEPVVEAPINLFDENDDAFLFIQPLFLGATYLGEIVVAVEDDYVLSTFGLDKLEEGNYDYELWHVDFLGESKIVIAVSDDSVDFSDAVKQTFNLPTTWNISILPKDGWITRAENVLIYSVALLLGFMIWGMWLLWYLKKKLEIANYTNSDTGLATLEGFVYFVNKHLPKKSNVNLCVLYIQLDNFRRFTKNIEYSEITKYLMHFKQSVIDCFTEDTIITRVNDDSFLVAAFIENKKSDDLVEDLILQLHWKRKVDDNKIFITPRYCMVTYPEYGKDAESLVVAVSRRFREKFEKE